MKQKQPGKREQRHIVKQRASNRFRNTRTTGHWQTQSVTPDENNFFDDTVSTRRSAKAYKTIFYSCTTLFTFFVVASIQSLTPDYNRGVNTGFAVVSILLSIFFFIMTLKAAGKIPAKLGLPALILSLALIAAYITGAQTQDILNGKPVLIGSNLHKAISMTRELDTLGKQIEADRIKYLSSTEVEGQALINELPALSSKWADLSSKLILRDPTGLPSLIWQPANKEIALAASSLSKGLTARIAALNTGDSTAIQTVNQFNVEVIEILNTAYADIRKNAAKEGVEKEQVVGG